MQSPFFIDSISNHSWTIIEAKIMLMYVPKSMFYKEIEPITYTTLTLKIKMPQHC